MFDVMMDLETLGVGPKAVVVSVGAVFFDPYTSNLGAQFMRVCDDLNDQQKRGREIDAGTVVWWMDQDKIAQSASFKERTFMRPTIQVLHDFASFIGPANRDEVRIWGNGASFDNIILASLYADYGVELPWRFFNDRCHRTYKSMPFAPEKFERTGTHHNPLDDAITQARQHQMITARLNEITMQRAA
jgi:hypothetical protein